MKGFFLGLQTDEVKQGDSSVYLVFSRLRVKGRKKERTEVKDARDKKTRSSEEPARSDGLDRE